MLSDLDEFDDQFFEVDFLEILIRVFLKFFSGL